MSLAGDRNRSHLLTDPELMREFSELETDEDREDFLDALEALEEVEREGTIDWESLKRELEL